MQPLINYTFLNILDSFKGYDIFSLLKTERIIMYLCKIEKIYENKNKILNKRVC